MLVRNYFAKRSEKLKPEDELHGRLFNEAEDGGVVEEEGLRVAASITRVKAHEREKRGRKPLPDDLPRKGHSTASCEEEIRPLGMRRVFEFGKTGDLDSEDAGAYDSRKYRESGAFGIHDRFKIRPYFVSFNPFSKSRSRDTAPSAGQTSILRFYAK
jgi:hypothetical protein